METKEILKSLRKDKGLSSQQVADGCEMSLGVYKKYESGERGVGTPALCKLADFYGVTTDYLLGREPKQEPEIDYAEVKKKTDALIERIENLPPEYQDVMDKIIHMLYDVEQKAQPPEIQQSKMVAVDTVGDFLERKKQAQEDEETQKKETA